MLGFDYNATIAFDEHVVVRAFRFNQIFPNRLRQTGQLKNEGVDCRAVFSNRKPNGVFVGIRDVPIRRLALPKCTGVFEAG